MSNSLEPTSSSTKKIDHGNLQPGMPTPFLVSLLITVGIVIFFIVYNSIGNIKVTNSELDSMKGLLFLFGLAPIASVACVILSIITIKKSDLYQNKNILISLSIAMVLISIICLLSFAIPFVKKATVLLPFIHAMF